LGLYISKGIIDKHNGYIWVQSSGEGEGATFTVLLPLEPVIVETEDDNQNQFAEIDDELSPSSALSLSPNNNESQFVDLENNVSTKLLRFNRIKLSCKEEFRFLTDGVYRFSSNDTMKGLPTAVVSTSTGRTIPLQNSSRRSRMFTENVINNNNSNDTKRVENDGQPVESKEPSGES
jgi:hypothetical protein